MFDGTSHKMVLLLFVLSHSLASCIDHSRLFLDVITPANSGYPCSLQFACMSPIVQNNLSSKLKSFPHSYDSCVIRQKRQSCDTCINMYIHLYVKFKLLLVVS